VNISISLHASPKPPAIRTNSGTRGHKFGPEYRKTSGETLIKRRPVLCVFLVSGPQEYVNKHKILHTAVVQTKARHCPGFLRRKNPLPGALPGLHVRSTCTDEGLSGARSHDSTFVNPYSREARPTISTYASPGISKGQPQFIRYRLRKSFPFFPSMSPHISAFSCLFQRAKISIKCENLRGTLRNWHFL